MQMDYLQKTKIFSKRKKKRTNNEKSERRKVISRNAKSRKIKLFKTKLKPYPDYSKMPSITNVTLPKKEEKLACKKAPKNKLLNMSTG